MHKCVQERMCVGGGGGAAAWRHIYGAIDTTPCIWRHIYGAIYDGAINMAPHIYGAIYMAPYIWRHIYGATYIWRLMYGAIYMAPSIYGAIYGAIYLCWAHNSMPGHHIKNYTLAAKDPKQLGL